MQDYVAPSSETYRPYSAFENSGLPGVAQMGLDMLASQMGSPYGALPFGGHSSYIGVRNQQAFTQAHQIAMRTAGAADRQGLIELQQSIAKMTNQAWTPEAQQVAAGRADAMIGMYGMASASPALMHGIDMALGGRSILPIAHYVHAAGRSQYDPATQMSHMSGNSAAMIAQQIHSNFYGDMALPNGTVVPGADSWRSRTKGLHAMEMGQLYGHLSSRGMMSSTLDYSEMFDLSTASGQEGATKEHAQRVSATLRDRAGGLAAMKELFEGTNAPIPQMLNAMEALTGGTQQLTPMRAELLVRNLKAAADGAQVTVEGLMMISQQSEQMTNALGINKAFGGQMTAMGLNTMEALQRTVAMGHGYWGLSDIDTLRVKQQAAMGRGIASDFGNAAGALGVLLENLPNDGNSAQARQLYEDMKAGRTDTPLFREFAQMRRESQINFIAEQTGLSASEVAAQFDATGLNQEKVYKDALGGAIQDAQRVEFGAKFLGRQFSATTGAMLDRMLGGDEETARLNSMLSQTGITTLMNMDQETRGNTQARFGDMAVAMRDQLEQAAANGDTQAARLLQQLSGQPGGTIGALTRLAQQQYGTADAAMNGGLADMLTLNSPEVIGERNAARQRTQLSALEGYSMAGMIEGNWVARFTNALRDEGRSGDPKADYARVLRKTLNIETSDESLQKLGSLMVSMESAAQELQDLEGAPLAPLEGESTAQWQARKAARSKEISQKRKLFEDRANEVRAQIESDPAMKEAYDKYLKSQGGAGAGEGGVTSIENAELSATNLTLNVDQMTINGQLVRDATGSGSANRKGRNTGSVA